MKSCLKTSGDIFEEEITTEHAAAFSHGCLYKHNSANVERQFNQNLCYNCIGRVENKDIKQRNGRVELNSSLSPKKIKAGFGGSCL
jgi:hypothetical protein